MGRMRERFRVPAVHCCLRLFVLFVFFFFSPPISCSEGELGAFTEDSLSFLLAYFPSSGLEGSLVFLSALDVLTISTFFLSHCGILWILGIGWPSGNRTDVRNYGLIFIKKFWKSCRFFYEKLRRRCLNESNYACNPCIFRPRRWSMGMRLMFIFIFSVIQWFYENLYSFK